MKDADERIRRFSFILHPSSFILHPFDMADSEKASLYNEIVCRTSDKVMLERMRLYGFWPAREGLPQDPPDESAERATIEAEIVELRRAQSKVKNPDKALAE